jgi:Transposase IS66 family
VGGTTLRKIGEDVTKTLISCRDPACVREVLGRVCEAISQPPAPLHLIARGRAGPKLLAHVLFSSMACNERSRTLAIDLGSWLRQQRAEVSKNSETEGHDYSPKRWIALTRFLDDGRLCMTNNAAERELRAIAVGRRN